MSDRHEEEMNRSPGADSPGTVSEEAPETLKTALAMRAAVLMARYGCADVRRIRAEHRLNHPGIKEATASLVKATLKTATEAPADVETIGTGNHRDNAAGAVRIVGLLQEAGLDTSGVMVRLALTISGKVAETGRLSTRNTGDHYPKSADEVMRHANDARDALRALRVAIDNEAAAAEARARAAVLPGFEPGLAAGAQNFAEAAATLAGIDADTYLPVVEVPRTTGTYDHLATLRTIGATVGNGDDSGLNITGANIAEATLDVKNAYCPACRVACRAEGRTSGWVLSRGILRDHNAAHPDHVADLRPNQATLRLPHVMGTSDGGRIRVTATSGGLHATATRTHTDTTRAIMKAKTASAEWTAVAGANAAATLRAEGVMVRLPNGDDFTPLPVQPVLFDTAAGSFIGLAVIAPGVKGVDEGVGFNHA